MPIPAKSVPLIDVADAGIVSYTLTKLLNEFPGLAGKQIKFSTLDEASGIGFFLSDGTVLLSNAESITGHVRQTCGYPFRVVYRAAPKTEIQKMRMKEFLDTIGRWLEQQTVTLDGLDYKLNSYPELGRGRVIRRIIRTAPAHMGQANKDGIEDWVIAAMLQYEVEYDK